MSRGILLAVSAVILGGAFSLPQNQGLKTVKGGPESGAFRYDATANLDRFRVFNTSSRYNATGTGAGNRTAPHAVIDFDVGVCWREVPTASLVKDPHNIPAGNGSSPAMSRIRDCCKGFTRNIYNFRRCDPVCSQECVNALCTAPETCTCFPEHVKNLAGYCMPTCPIGCQNGQCAGGECLCEPGYKLDADSKYCAPVCRDNCGGRGNCTAPNTCICEKEFRLGQDGSCHASCSNCVNGDCIGPNNCACHKGYSKNQHGECVPVCSKGCTNGACIAPDVCACAYGFELDQAVGLCQPKCLSPCLNALCTGPDTCTCKPGYVKNNQNPIGNVCVPHCPGGCPNGICSGPNFCVCNFGYVKDRGVKGSQSCVRAPPRLSRAVDAAVARLLTYNIPL